VTQSNQQKLESDWCHNAISTIQLGEVVALPYERLFGLAADAMNPRAVAKVAKIKERPGRRIGQKPISVILPDMDRLRKVVTEITPAAKRLMDRHWPGPLTLVMKAAPGLPSPLVSERGLVGVRLAGPSPAAELARRSGMVLTATSANLKDAADALSDEDVKDLVGIHMLVKGTVDGPPGSTVVDASGNRPVVLRTGFVEIEWI
jgi:L-threonylcarbamoyladenylate synthase